MATTKELFAKVQQNITPDLVDKVKGVYQFNLGDEKWTVDLKTAPGSVKEGPVDKADCTLTIAKVDFLDMAAGKLNGQQAFMQGKLKISGNMAFAMKLGMLFEARAPAAGASAPAASSSAASAEPLAMVFSEIDKNVKADPSLAKKVNGIYQFNITASNGQAKFWTVDLKNEPGKVFEGKPEKADVTMSMKEEDFLDLVTGNLDGQSAFMQGKLRMVGNMALAMKLGTVLGSKAPKQAKL